MTCTYPALTARYLYMASLPRNTRVLYIAHSTYAHGRRCFLQRPCHARGSNIFTLYPALWTRKEKLPGPWQHAHDYLGTMAVQQRHGMRSFSKVMPWESCESGWQKGHPNAYQIIRCTAVAKLRPRVLGLLPLADFLGFPSHTSQTAQEDDRRGGDSGGSTDDLQRRPVATVQIVVHPHADVERQLFAAERDTTETQIQAPSSDGSIPGGWEAKGTCIAVRGLQRRAAVAASASR